MPDVGIMKNIISILKESFTSLVKDTLETSLVLIKIVVPALTLTRLLEELCVTEHLRWQCSVLSCQWLILCPWR